MEFLSKGRGRYCFLLTGDKNKKDQDKNLPSKVVVVIAQTRTIVSSEPNETLKPLRIDIHQSQNMTFATRSSKRLFPSNMIIPSNNTVFGERPSPLLRIVQKFFTAGFDN